MEDNIKIVTVEYLSIHWLDPLQISNLSPGDHKPEKDWNEEKLNKPFLIDAP